MKWNPFTPHGTRFSDQERRLLHMRMRLWDCQAGPTLFISCALSCSLIFIFFIHNENYKRVQICYLYSKSGGFLFINSQEKIIYLLETIASCYISFIYQFVRYRLSLSHPYKILIPKKLYFGNVLLFLSTTNTSLQVAFMMHL